MDETPQADTRQWRRRPTRGSGRPYRRLAVACLLGAACGSIGASAECLRYADQSRINKLLSDGGPETRIELCQGQTYDISSPIIFTAKNQEISTEGYPTDDALKARIVLQKDWTANDGMLGGVRRGISGEGAAIIGDCRRCAHIALKNVIIDGNRAALGRVLPSMQEPSPLVLLGNNEGQVVSGCTVRDPRGWTAIQLREGDNLSCEGAVIEDNKIGPAGEEWIVDVDGEDPENSPLGRPLASGLSIACRGSTVVRNSFVDTTDAAIVIYGSPGSLISSNYILSSTRSQMAGILMADLEPFDGDYTNTRVINNTLEAEENALMRVAIGLGAAVLSDDMETTIRGGIVKQNKIKGIGMGYGIAASGLKDFVVIENESTARHGGKRGVKCLMPVEPGEEGYAQLTEAEKEHGVVKNPLPTAFLRNERYIFGGDWQEDFIQGEFAYVVCIDPDAIEPDGASTEKAESPPRPPPPSVPVQATEEIIVRDASEDIPLTSNEEEEDTVGDEAPTGNAVFDDILLHSQARMLESITALGRDVDLLIAGGRGKSRGSVDLNEGGEILAQLAELSSRISRLETERSVLRKTIDDLNAELNAFGKNLARTESQESKSVEELLSLLTAKPVKRTARTATSEDGVDTLEQDAWILPIIYVVGSQLAVMLIGWIWTKLSRRDKRHKNI